MTDNNTARHLRVVQDSPDDYVEEVFGESGYLADKFDGYKVRDGQVELTRAVAKALEEILVKGMGVGHKNYSSLIGAQTLARREET